MAKQQTRSSSRKRVFYWIIAIVLFYILTTATVSSGIVEDERELEQAYAAQEPYVVEKMARISMFP